MDVKLILETLNKKKQPKPRKKTFKQIFQVDKNQVSKVKPKTKGKPKS